MKRVLVKGPDPAGISQATELNSGSRSDCLGTSRHDGQYIGPQRPQAHPFAMLPGMQATASNARQATAEALERAAGVGRELNAFISTLDDFALQQADRVTQRAAAGEELPLGGLPVVIKDNLSLEGQRTTAASEMLRDYVAPFTASSVQRLLDAGAVPVAKANLDEFAMGSSNESSAFGPVRNPHDLSRVPGGSSGGSAAAVAAGIVPVALGTDTGGSVRQPASFCGILGLKPTYGRVSRWGSITLAMSLDQVGVFARSTHYLRRTLNVIAGPDERDATTVALARKQQPDSPESVSGLKVGLISELSGDWNSPGVQAALQETTGLLESFGAQTGSFSLSTMKLVAPSYLLLCSVEAASALARFDGMSFGLRAGEDALGQERVMQLSREQGLGKEVRRRVLIGSLALSEEQRANYYDRAIRARELIRRELLGALNEFDLLLCPTTPSVAFELGQPAGVGTYRGDTATNLANLAGLPAISIPGARAEQGLPIGMQLIGRPLAEETLLLVAQRFEDHYGADFAPVAAP